MNIQYLQTEDAKESQTTTTKCYALPGESY